MGDEVNFLITNNMRLSIIFFAHLPVCGEKSGG
jgi:hypothetical protein